MKNHLTIGVLFASAFATFGVAGRRAQLRRRLAEGPDALLDHELIEYLLTLAIFRRDTGSLAKDLIGQFGSIANVLTADWRALTRVPEMGEASVAAIKVVHAAALRLLRAQVAAKPVLSSRQALLDYLYADMAHLPVERVRVLHLNSRNMLIRDEHMGDGSVDHVMIYVREVVRRAIDFGSAKLILVHNHPSGSAAASRQDIETTRHVVAASKPLGISVHDHIIIAGNEYVSMRDEGLL